jgi:hypothetical protein
MKQLQPNEFLREWPVSEIARLDRMFRPALENANQDDYLCQVKTAAPTRIVGSSRAWKHKI